ncbi:hypothetical protein F511_13025 [Dorcoceras hygrometricum]|uniref:Uncharacterized protein n=1 Tax=Dorcoceras hygrometricum TaxID=472368 RepID=A0A2Z7AME3_9LAMI|nr:hypothetical protein F511_13025 [Dorcoceras hygrometricum]
MFDKFEVVIPGPEERAHLPPRGFHIFYMNQLDMDLRFPLPRFIAALCHHIKISTIQLAPKSYSFLLALGVLLRYYNLPLVPYVFMQLVQVKRLGPGKFYLSHKGDHAFIKGNPSSHKGWMSRFFFVKRVEKKRDPWKCDMSWRDNMYTLTPSTPERSPNLDSFLDAMRDKSYSSPELIKEDLLLIFWFIMRGVKLVGDLDERMGKTEMLKALEVKVGSSRATAPSKKAAKKRRATTPVKKEARREKKKQKEEASTSGALGVSTTETLQATATEKGGGSRAISPLNLSEDSLVVFLSRAVATRFLCHMVPDRDIGRLGEPRTRRLWACLHPTSHRQWLGGRGDKTPHPSLTSHERYSPVLDKAMGQHSELVERLEDLEALGAQEKRAARPRGRRWRPSWPLRADRAVEEEAIRSARRCTC